MIDGLKHWVCLFFLFHFCFYYYFFFCLHVLNIFFFFYSLYNHLLHMVCIEQNVYAEKSNSNYDLICYDNVVT